MKQLERIQTPIVETNAFSRLDTPFAVGIVAIGDQVVDGHQNVFESMGRFRGDVYSSMGYVNRSELDEYGTDFDLDDSRSIHFATLERTSIDGLARIVGNMRLIIKSDEQFLPVEESFPDSFIDQPASFGSTEVSRLISQHEDPVIKALIKWPMFKAGLEYVQQHGLGPVFGVVEPRLTRSLLAQDVPVIPLSNARYLEHINATKQPIMVDAEGLSRTISVLNFQNVPLKNGVFSYADISKSEVPYAQEGV